MEPTDTRIVVLQRGWNIVGHYTIEDDQVVVRDASVIRYWGTTRGLGELRGGPLSGTKLDPIGEVRAHPLAVVFTAVVDAAAWDSHLK